MSRIEEFDYVIVGAGSAGCVLAHRLTETAGTRILLLEAGGRDLNPFIHMPAGLAKLVSNRRINWGFVTETESALNGRRLFWPRGRVLGGSSSINAMCYIRGHAADYDEWAALGLADWQYSAVLPYFRKAEDQARGSSEFHGTGGPLSVEDLRHRNPLSHVFLEAASELGFKPNDDFNAAVQEGFGFYQATLRNARRCSTAVGYLQPALARRGLKVLTKAPVERIWLEDGRAVGVEYRRGSTAYRVRARREVLLCGGTIASPQLLMCSGIGPPRELERVGITVRVPREEVGRNLQDHLDYCTLHKCNSPVTYDFSVLAEALAGLRFALAGTGPGASNIAEAGGFVRSHLAADARPDLQFHFVPAQLDDHGRNKLPGHGFTLHVCFLRPASRGSIGLNSASMRDPPRIEANYLSEPADLAHLVAGVRLSRDIFAARAFSPWRGPEVFPGAMARSDRDLTAAIRAKAESIYHPVGTCRMGTDGSSVVDAELRVRGVEGLRVVDASIMPRLIGGNTNAPTIMIAEKAADLIKADA